MFCTHARRAWNCPTSGIAKTLHELFSIQHHQLFWHMGPDPLWQTATWLARALQLIRHALWVFSVPGAISAPSKACRAADNSPSNTHRKALCARRGTSAFCLHLFLQQALCASLPELLLLRTPLAPLELRKTFQQLWFRDLASSWRTGKQQACGRAKRKASKPESISPRFHQLVLPMPLSDCSSDCTYVWPFQHVGMDLITLPLRLKMDTKSTSSRHSKPTTTF